MGPSNHQSDPIKQLAEDETGATTLEWALLLGAVVLPSFIIIQRLLDTLVSYYGLMTTLNGMPLP